MSIFSLSQKLYTIVTGWFS